MSPLDRWAIILQGRSLENGPGDPRRSQQWPGKTQGGCVLACAQVSRKHLESLVCLQCSNPQEAKGSLATGYGRKWVGKKVSHSSLNQLLSAPLPVGPILFPRCLATPWWWHLCTISFLSVPGLRRSLRPHCTQVSWVWTAEPIARGWEWREVERAALPSLCC